MESDAFAQIAVDLFGERLGKFLTHSDGYPFDQFAVKDLALFADRLFKREPERLRNRKVTAIFHRRVLRSLQPESRHGKPTEPILCIGLEEYVLPFRISFDRRKRLVLFDGDVSKRALLRRRCCRRAAGPYP